MDVAGEFAVLFILAAMGLALNAVLAAIRRRVLFWDPSQKAASAVATLKGAP
jgi:NitT/TauT family transport system permease protein